MADVLSEVRKGLEKRLHELEPLVEEHAHVRAALDALKGVGPRTRAATAPARRSRASKNGAGTGRGRPRGSGARAQEAVKHVHGHPGITIAEIAKRMKIKPNYLYRILPQLEKEGKVAKRDKGYHPADGSAAETEEKQSS
jgi:ribosomal protein S25